MAPEERLVLELDAAVGELLAEPVGDDVAVVGLDVGELPADVVGTDVAVVGLDVGEVLLPGPFGPKSR
jgi:hypothetical protein